MRGHTWALRVLAGIVIAAAIALPASAQEATPSVLVLDARETNAAVNLAGGNRLTVRHGDMVVNSRHSFATFCADSALDVQNGVLRIAGGAHGTGASTITPTPQALASPVADPLAALEYPTITDIRSRQRLLVSGDRATFLQPGYYLGGISAVGAGASLNLASGTYVITDGDFFTSGAEVIGDGVTIIMSGRSAGKLTFGSDSRVNLSAPREGPLKDILVVSGGQAAGEVTDVGFNKCRAIMRGAIYAPKGRVGLSFGAKVWAGRIVCYGLLLNTDAQMEVIGLPVSDQAWDRVIVDQTLSEAAAQ